MEPRREEQQKALEPSVERKPRRFRIVKLEERIAPAKVATVKQCLTRTCYYCNPTLINTCGGCTTW